MESRTDKDGPINQQTVIEQGNPSEMSGDHQFTQFFNLAISWMRMNEG